MSEPTPEQPRVDENGDPPPAKNGLDRRSVLLRGALGLTGVGSLVFGWTLLRRRGPHGKRLPDEQIGLRAALRAMKERQQDGIAIVVPERGADLLAEQLDRLIPLSYPGAGVRGPAADPEQAAVGNVLLEAVWVCVPASRADARPGETAVLLDPEGRRVAGGVVDFSGPLPFVSTARALLDTGGRRAARVKAMKSAGAEGLLARMASGEDRGASRAELQAHFAEWLPALLDDLATAGETDAAREIRWRLATLYMERVQSGVGLPYGLAWETLVHVPPDCPPCGMARPYVEGRRFIDFLSGDE